MVQMAHHLPNNNPHGQHNQSSFLAVRRPVTFQSVSRKEFGQMSPEELLLYNRELAKVRETETQEWVARQKAFEMNLVRQDHKRELLTQNNDVRKHLEKDAYFRANQEYLRLMNDEPSRQTFREKQRLTEDLEKQKRLLIEDLARDQQLKQDKYKRTHNSPYPSDLRTLHYLNDKPGHRELAVPLRIKPDHPFPLVDPRYPQHLSAAEEFHNYRRMQENMIKLGKHPIGIRQCSHSDFQPVQQELGPIIQEKEKKIKEIEDKLVRLGHEKKYQYLKKMEVVANQQHQLIGMKPEVISSMHSSIPRQPQPSPYRYSSSSSPPRSTSRLHYQQDLSSPTSKQSPQTSLHTTVSIGNNRSPPVTGQSLSSSVSVDKNNNIVKDENNHMNGNTDKNYSPKKEKLRSPEHSNSSHEDLVIDEKKQESGNDKESSIKKNDELHNSPTDKKLPSPAVQNTENSNSIKLENSQGYEGENVTTEVIGDDKTFNELKYGDKVRISSVMLDDKNSRQERDEGEEFENKNGGESNEQDANDVNNANRGMKKRKTQKLSGKREGSSSPPDFQVSQNRLALDLPGHNWLEKRLMQQNALTPNSNGTKSKTEDSRISDEDNKHNQQQQEQPQEQTKDQQQKQNHEHQQEPNVRNLSTSDSDDKFSTNKPSPSSKENNKETTSIDSQTLYQNGNISITTTIASMNVKPKELPRSELLLQMLDPNMSTPSLRPSQKPTDSSIKLSRNSPVSSSAENLIVSSPSREQLVNTVSAYYGSRTSPIVIPDALKTKPPVSPHLNDSEKRIEPRIYNNSDPKSPLESKISPSVSLYQEIRPNLVVERRRDPDIAQLPYILPKSLANENVPYSKFIVEERYNRKRPLDDVNREDQEAALKRAALKRAEFSERFFSDLERGMSSKGKAEMTNFGESKDIRLHLSDPIPATMQCRSLEELSAKERYAKLEATDYDYLSRFKESHSQPSIPYKASELVLKPPSRGMIPPQRTEYPVPRYLKRQISPPPMPYRLHDDKPLHRRGPSTEGLPPPVLNGRLEPGHVLPHHHRSESVDVSLLSSVHQSRERELKMLEEARRRDEFQRSSMEVRKERLLSQGMPGKMQGYKALSPSEEHLLNLNEKVRTVEDLRALQMGMPLANGFQRYMRPTQVFQNERLTDREKIALREADFIHQSTMQQEALVSRQEIQSAYLKHARRKASMSGKMTSPVSSASSIGALGHGFTEEQMRLASFRRQEEEEKSRAVAAHHERMLEERKAGEPFTLTKEVEPNHFDASIPRFFSHKIPRTRDGSLDFGRSKPVDYSFLDYSNPGYRDREAGVLVGNPLKRPSSVHTSSAETLAKLQRRSPPQNYLVDKHRVTENPGKLPGKSDVNPYEEKWRMLAEESEKRFCSICNKDAQYLCSGCRKVWYCSQDCQLNAWKTHSKTCSLVGDR